MPRKLIAILTALLAFNLLFFGFDKITPGIRLPWPGSIGTALTAIVAQVIIFFIFFPRKNTKHAIYGLIAGFFAIVCAVMSIFRGSWIDQMILHALTGGTIITSFYLLSLTHSRFGAVSEIFAAPLKLAQSWFEAGQEALHSIESIGVRRMRLFKISQTNTVALGAGLFLTLPIILLLVMLFSSADPIFGRFIQDTFTINWLKLDSWVIERVVFTLFVLIFLIPLVRIKVKNAYVSLFAANEKLVRYQLSVLVLGGAVSVLLLLFLGFQFHYLFAQVKETELIKFGINTYSEYVRKGFFELLAASVLVYFVAALNFLIIRSVDAHKAKIIRFVNILLLSEMGLFIISIFRRVYLYQAEHGLTRARVYGSAFLIILGILTVYLALRHFHRNKSWYLIEIISVGLLMFFTATVNVDQAIATIAPPTVNGERDHMHIAGLSTDAIEGWVSAYIHAKGEVAALATVQNQSITPDHARRIVYTARTLQRLRDNYDWMERQYEGTLGWNRLRNANVTEWLAYQKLKIQINKLELIGLNDQAWKLYSFLSEEQVFQSFDRSLDSPLMW